MARTWTTVGAELVDDRGRFARLFEALEWETVEGAKPMLPALNISETIKDLRIPRVSRVAISHDLAPYGLYGIEGHYKDGRARVYVVDLGTKLVPVASDHWPGPDGYLERLEQILPHA